ncbi:MAG TPA: hypothetical protein VF163_03270 [Micromonosporaceae bacterium]
MVGKATRGVVAVLMSLGCAVLSGCGSVGLQPPGNGRAAGPTASARPSGTPAADVLVEVPPVDVLVGATLRTAAGQRIDLGWAGRAPRAARIAAGWLIWGEDDVWLLSDAGERVQLWQGEPTLVVDADGERFAYRDGDQIVVARLAGSAAPIATRPAGAELVPVATTGGVGRFRPNAFVGDALLLSYSDSGDRAERFDLWPYHRGGYQPSPTQRQIVRATPDQRLIVGATPDGRRLIGLAAGDSAPCLATFDPGDLHLVARACGVAISIPTHAAISPDGQWLLAYRTDQSPPGVKGGNPVVAIDLTAAFSGKRSERTWPSTAADFNITDCVWPDSGSVWCADRGGLARLRIDGPDWVERVRLAGVAVDNLTQRPLTVVPVPHLGMSAG